MKRSIHGTRSHQRRGSVALFMIVILMMGGLMVTGLAISRGRDHDLTIRRIETVQAFYAAEGAMNMAMREIMEEADEDGDGIVGGISDDDNSVNDLTIAHAQAFVEVTDGGGTSVLRARGTSGRAVRTISASLAGGETASGLNLEAMVMSAYAGSQDVTGSVSFINGGTGVNITGNRWLAFEFPYSMTPNTVISFEFASASEGEIHAIGLEESVHGQSSNRVFKVHGTQNWGIRDFDNYSGSGWTSYTIPVGSYYVIDATHLVILMDHDVSNPTGNSMFRSIRVYEQ